MHPRAHIGSGNSLGFALIGCGRAGERHVVQAAKIGRFVAACDINEAAALRLCRDVDVDLYTDYGAMLAAVQNKVDVVAVVYSQWTALRAFN